MRNAAVVVMGKHGSIKCTVTRGLAAMGLLGVYHRVGTLVSQKNWWFSQTRFSTVLRRPCPGVFDNVGANASVLPNPKAEKPSTHIETFKSIFLFRDLCIWECFHSNHEVWGKGCQCFQRVLSPILFQITLHKRSSCQSFELYLCAVFRYLRAK